MKAQDRDIRYSRPQPLGVEVRGIATLVAKLPSMARTAANQRTTQQTLVALDTLASVMAFISEAIVKVQEENREKVQAAE